MLFEFMLSLKLLKRIVDKFNFIAKRFAKGNAYENIVDNNK